jgi:DNA-binding transcriptional LysR family regulator
MNVRLLKSFIAVCESRNITESAERLHISQPALSRRVAELQRMLGVELFEREGRRLRPNHAASEILPVAQEAVDAFERLHEAARALAGRTGGAIRLGAAPPLPSIGGVPRCGKDSSLPSLCDTRAPHAVATNRLKAQRGATWPTTISKS